jgi:hypothetical protein
MEGQESMCKRGCVYVCLKREGEREEDRERERANLSFYEELIA